MTAYVDHPQLTRYRRMRMCHLVADTPEELHSLATTVGCKPEWFQVSRSGVPHYDLPMFRRRAAIAAGAREVSRRELAVIIRAIKL